MAKPEWGVKRICHNCGAPFYDLRRDPIVCPKCGTTFDPEAILKSRRTRVPIPEEKEVEPVAADEEADTETTETEEAEEAEEEEEAPAAASEEEEDEELIEDASELGEDEDDMAEVIENIEDDEER